MHRRSILRFLGLSNSMLCSALSAYVFQHIASFSDFITQAYQECCESLLSAANASYVAVARHYRPCWDKECETLYSSFVRAPVGTDSDRAASSLLFRLEQKKLEQWEKTVNSIDLSRSNRKAWKPVNKLTGRSGHSSCLCPVSANSIASQLVKNGNINWEPRIHQACQQAAVRQMEGPNS